MKLMNTIYLKRSLAMVILAIAINACVPELTKREVSRSVPDSFSLTAADTVNTAEINWKVFFKEKPLVALIDTALKNNQELNIVMQEIEIARNEARARKGEYLPSVNAGVGAEVDKVGKYTRNGVVEENHEIKGEKFPEPLTNLEAGLYASWEVDVWRKLRNAKSSACARYLASVEGKNFLVTNLIAEIANSYYELLALKSQLSIVRQNIEIQSNALEIVKLQKKSARVTELAVRRFEAQVLGTKSLQYNIQQEIVEIENRINFLVGRFPQSIAGDADTFNSIELDTVSQGLPSQMLENRPDIREAELMLTAARLDVKVAKADFFPSLGLSAGIGFQAFKPQYLVKTPESLIYNVAGELTAPLVNRNAIKAQYNSANARQIQAVFDYEQTVLNAYIEVVNQLSKIGNLKSSYDLKARQVQALTESVDISNTLFKSARADYMEVLLTQREALEARFELIETKKEQLNASVNLYRALGGGW